MSSTRRAPVSTAALRGALRTVMDPCSLATATPMDVDTMGLIETLDVSEHGDVAVTLTLTQPTCWFFFDLCEAVENALEAVEGVASVHVEVSGDLWTPDRMRGSRDRRRARPLPLTRAASLRSEPERVAVTPTDRGGQA